MEKDQTGNESKEEKDKLEEGEHKEVEPEAVEAVPVTEAEGEHKEVEPETVEEPQGKEAETVEDKGKEAETVEVEPKVEPTRRRLFEIGLLIGAGIFALVIALILLYNPTLGNFGADNSDTEDGYTNDKAYKVGQYPTLEVKEGAIESYSSQLRGLLEGNTKKFDEVDYINIAFQSDLEYLIEQIAKNYFMDYSLMHDKKCEVVADCLVYVDEERKALIEKYGKQLREVFAYIDTNVEYQQNGDSVVYNDYVAESLARKEIIVDKMTKYVKELDYTNNKETVETFLYKVSVGKGDILTELDSFATMVKNKVAPAKK